MASLFVKLEVSRRIPVLTSLRNTDGIAVVYFLDAKTCNNNLAESIRIESMRPEHWS